jgi:uncharacterized membrane protein YgcG
MSEQPVDLGAVARDDALLDALGRGAEHPPADEFAAMLATWRADLTADEDVADPAPARKPTRARRGRLARIVLAAAAAVLALAGTATVAAGRAEPGSPLWPITNLVYADRADSLVAAQDARHALAQAREAVTAGRYAEADRLLNRATALAGGVRESGTRQLLLDEIAAVQALLPAATPAPTTSGAPGSSATPTPKSSPSRGAGSGSHAGGGSTGGGNRGGGNTGGTPSPSASSGGGLTNILPSLPLPSLPLPPLPTL